MTSADAPYSQTAPPDAGGPVLSAMGLRVEIATADRRFAAVRGIDFELRRGETLALVGESGSGKSLTGLALMRLLPEPPARIVAGRLLFAGVDLAAATEQQMLTIRGNRIAMVFQEPMTSLNPSMRVGDQVAEALRLHRCIGRHEALDIARGLFARVQIPDPARRLEEYPHRMSGGMRQRVMIALALACGPDAIVADEPTTALDVTTQAQILRLFRRLQNELGMGILLITHDLGVVAQSADHVAVMYAGRIVEEAPAVALFEAPLHPYTIGLLACVPGVQQEQAGGRGKLAEIAGSVPPLWALTAGCAFAPRCPRASVRCTREDPMLEAHGPARRVACHHAGEQQS